MRDLMPLMKPLNDIAAAEIGYSLSLLPEKAGHCFGFAS
jgi:hypothetical protein